MPSSTMLYNDSWSQNSSPLESPRHEYQQSNSSDHSPTMRDGFPISPPPAIGTDTALPRHQLDAVIPESPAEEETSTKDASVLKSMPRRQSSLNQPSPLSQDNSHPRQRPPSIAGSSPGDSSTSMNSAAKSKKSGGLLRKLSGLNIFHHDAKHQSGHAADLKAARAGHSQTELTHPHTGAISKPMDMSSNSSITASPPRRPKFSMGDSASNTPSGSRMPSRTPSVDATSAHKGSFGSRAPSVSGSVTGASPESAPHSPKADSPHRDHEDFIARKPTRANSTFNFFRKPNTGSSPLHDAPIARAASFHHGETRPVAIPGVHHEGSSGEMPMASLSRTLSKASLLGGSGWGTITDKLPSFDTLYTYKDASEKKIKLDMHGKLGQIGEGAGGVIRTARLKPGKHPAYNPSSTGGDLGLFAVKTFRKQSDKESEGWYCQKLVREFRVHCALNHDNIVKLADICVEQKKFGDPMFVAVLDFCVGGDLFDLHYHAWNAIDQGVMSKVERNCVYKQLMFAVNYMHQQGIAHRDIKLENLLINGHGQVKLADFGTSNFTRGADAEPCRGFVGTDHSVPPEAYLSALITGDNKPEYDGTKADIWACAVTWHVLTWSNDEPTAVLRAYPFGEEGADPDNKQWQKYMNSIKRHEPDRYIPGWDLYLERKTDKHHTSTPPQTPTVGRQDSIALSAASGQSGVSELDAMFDPSDPSAPKDDLRDPLRRCRPFANGFPGSGFTAAKGMLDPDPDRRWSAKQVIDDPFFALIECCHKDSNPQGYDSSKERQRKGLHKVHNHIRPAARKLMEQNKVEQARNEEKTIAMRHAA